MYEIKFNMDMDMLDMDMVNRERLLANYIIALSLSL